MLIWWVEVIKVENKIKKVNQKKKKKKNQNKENTNNNNKKNISQTGGFNKYLSSVAEAFENQTDRYSKNSTGVEHDAAAQVGGGYSTNPENMIAGMPTYDKYDECCQPLLSKGRLTTSLSVSKPLCGSGAQKGGAKNKKRRTSRKK